MCSFTNEMKSTYNFVALSKVSTNHFFCTVCGKDISLSHGGKDDIEKHSKTPSHNKNERATSSTRVNNYFSSSKDDLPPSINAEVQMAPEKPGIAMGMLVCCGKPGIAMGMLVCCGKPGIAMGMLVCCGKPGIVMGYRIVIPNCL